MSNNKNNNKSSIRFGIMCSSTRLHAWQVKAITTLTEQEGVEVGLLILDDRPKTKGNSHSRLSRIRKQFEFKSLLWLLYCGLVKLRTKANKDVDYSKPLTQVPVLKCVVEKKGKFSEYFSEKDVEAIQGYNLDFILRFGFGIIRGDVLTAARYGVWSFHHDDEMKYRGRPPCFWEIYNGDKVTGSILQRLTDRLDGGIILRRGFLKTNYSYVKNRDQMLFESAQWPAIISKDIRNGNTHDLDAIPSKTTAPIYYAPTNPQMVFYLLRAIGLRLKEIYKKIIFMDYWNVGVVNEPIQRFLTSESLPDSVWYPRLPRHKFMADPFGITIQNKLYIFYEEFPYKAMRGNISVVTYENDKFSEPKVVLDEPFHMSYPHIFEHEGDIYCIPETAEVNQVILYKAVDFPYSWKKDRVLIDQFAGIDSTLFQFNNKWWLFAGNKHNGGYYNLNLFYSDHIFEGWKPHPKNPVKTDIRSARPAGTPFTHKGKLFRPSMDYSMKAEGRITINVVEKLSTIDYQESEHGKIDPYSESAYPDKIHTLCRAGEMTIIDGCKEVCIFTNVHMFTYKMRASLRGILKRLGYMRPQPVSSIY